MYQMYEKQLQINSQKSALGDVAKTTVIATDALQLFCTTTAQKSYFPLITLFFCHCYQTELQLG